MKLKVASDATSLKMLMLSVGLIALLILFPEYRDWLAYLVTALSVAFSLTYKRSLPYFFVLVFLVYTNFCSLTGSMSTSSAVGFESGVMIGTAIILLQTWKQSRFYHPAALVLLLSLSISILVAYFRFGQPLLGSLLRLFQRYLIFFLVFPLAQFLRENGNASLFLTYCLNISCIVCLILCFHFFFVPREYAFLDLALKSRYSGSQGYLLHMASPTFCLVLGATLLKENKGISDFLKISVILFTMVVVAQTRTFLFCALVLIVYALLIYNRRIRPTSKLGVALIVLCVVLALLPSLLEFIGNRFFAGILAQGEDYIRFREIRWFHEINTPYGFWGIGLEDRAFLGSPYAAGVAQLRYYISDLGILGVYYQFGVFGVLGIVFYLVSMRRGLGESSPYARGLYSCLILSIGVTCVTTSPLQHGIPILLVFSAIHALTQGEENGCKQHVGNCCMEEGAGDRRMNGQGLAGTERGWRKEGGGME